MKTIIISPAQVGGAKPGRKIQRIVRGNFKSGKGKELSEKLRREGVTCCVLFEYISGGSYFRNKLMYARKFGDRQYIISPDGLLSPSDILDLPAVKRYMKCDMKGDKTLQEKIRKRIKQQAENLGIMGDEVIFIGSQEYLNILKPIFPNLKYPLKLKGKSNIEKAKILEEAIRSGSELNYERV